MYDLTIHCEDIDTLKIHSNAMDMYLSIERVKNMIRTRIKHGNPSDEEIEMLEKIREELFLD